MRLPASRTILAAVLLSVGGASIFSACATKDRENKTLVLKSDAAVVSTPEQAMQKLQEFYDLYGPADGFSKAEIKNIYTKFEERIRSFTGSAQVDADEAADLAFSLQADGSSTLRLGKAIEDSGPNLYLLKWTMQNPIQYQALRTLLSERYPHATASTTDDLGRVLMLYGEPWAGGSGKDSLSMKDAVAPALLTHEISKHPFAPRVQDYARAGMLDRLVVQTIDKKLKQQIFLRHEVWSIDALSSDDQQLEWLILALKYKLIDKLVDHESPPGSKGIPAAALGPALARITGQDMIAGSRLAAIYDHPLEGGNQDHYMSAREVFDLVTDLEFAGYVDARLHHEVSRVSVPRDLLLYTQILSLYPSVGVDLFSPEHWKTTYSVIKSFDSEKLGGNDDGHLDVTELTSALAWITILDRLYAAYSDNPTDREISRKRVDELFQMFGIKDSKATNAFFAGLRLDSRPDLMDTGRYVLASIFWRKSLKPTDFYVRMVRNVPALLEHADQVAPPNPNMGSRDAGTNTPSLLQDFKL